MIVVFDMDGVLADDGHRLHHILVRPKDFVTFYQTIHLDPPILVGIKMCEALLAQGHQCEVWTGREDVARDQTLAWLDLQGLSGVQKVKMRNAGDHRESHFIKEEWLLKCFPCEKPDVVFEDEPRNVEMFRKHGIPCFDLGKGFYTQHTIDHDALQAKIGAVQG